MRIIASVFFKRLLENIKQTRDRQCPNDKDANMKLYAVCDLALNIIMSKTSNFVLKEFPAEPVLPSKLFTDPDTTYSNLKTYLPPEIIDSKPLKSGFEIEIFEGAKGKSSSAKNGGSTTNVSSDDELSIINNELNEISQQSTSSNKFSHRLRTRKKSVSKFEKSSKSDTHLERSNGGNYSNAEASATGSKEDSSIQSHHSNDSALLNKSEIDYILNNKRLYVSLSDVNLQSKRSSRSSVNSRSSIINSTSSDVCNTASSKTNVSVLSSSKASSLCPPNLKHLIKDCNVTLNKEEVERYTSKFLNSSLNHSESSNSLSTLSKRRSDSESASLSSDEFSGTKDSLSKNDKFQGKRKSREHISNSSSLSSKRKREISPALQLNQSRNVNSKNSIKEGLVSSNISSSDLEKLSVKNAKELRVTLNRTHVEDVHSFPAKKINNSIKKINKVPLVNGNRGNRNARKITNSPTEYKQKTGNPHTVRQNRKNEVKINVKKR